MLCKILKGSIRVGRIKRSIGDIIEISADDYRRLRNLVEKVPNLQPENVESVKPKLSDSVITSHKQDENLGQKDIQTFVSNTKMETKSKNIKGAKK